MKRTRRNHTAAFKAKVALVAIKGEKTLAVGADAFLTVRHEVACRSCSHFSGGNHPCHRVNLGA